MKKNGKQYWNCSSQTLAPKSFKSILPPGCRLPALHRKSLSWAFNISSTKVRKETESCSIQETSLSVCYQGKRLWFHCDVCTMVRATPWHAQTLYYTNGCTWCIYFISSVDMEKKIGGDFFSLVNWLTGIDVKITSGQDLGKDFWVGRGERENSIGKRTHTRGKWFSSPGKDVVKVTMLNIWFHIYSENDQLNKIKIFLLVIFVEMSHKKKMLLPQ